MFSTKEYLQKRTGPYGIGRLSYLQALVSEFQETSSNEAKRQVLANLASFAYDPINYDYLRQLNVIDLFLDCLTESDDVIVEFAIGGICNLCLDKKNKSRIIEHPSDGICLVTGCLSNSNIETVLSAITTLMYLMTPESKNAMVRFSNSTNPRVANLASVFCQDYCSRQQLAEAEAMILSDTRSDHTCCDARKADKVDDT